MKKHIRKKKGIALIAMLLSICILAGCGKKDTAAVQTPVASAVPEETSSPEATDAPESATTPETSADKEAASHGKGKYTIEEIAQDVVINGQKVSIPFTLEDLGDDYRFDDKREPLEWEKGYTDSVMFKDEERWIFTAMIESDDGKLERTSKIFDIHISRRAYNNTESLVKGLGIGDSLGQMKEIFGEADEVSENGKGLTSYWYGNKESNFFCVGVRDENVVQFTVRYLPKKIRKRKRIATCGKN